MARSIVRRGLMSAALLGALCGHAAGQDFNGDGAADIAIGAPGETIAGAVGCGAVTVIFGAGPALGLDGAAALPSIQLLQSTFGFDLDEPGDAFGAAIAWGDFNMDGFDDLAIGAPGEDSPAGVPDCGVVFVYYGFPGGFIPIGPPILPQGALGDAEEAGDASGFALASGDFNFDGVDDLAIGVPLEDIGAGDEGMVHQVWGIPGAGLLPGFAPIPAIIQALAGDVPEPGDNFGYALAAGELDGTPGADLAIGAPLEDFAGDADAGMVNVLYNTPGFGLDPGAITLPEAWTQDSPCVPEVTNPGDLFGACLAIGDFDVNPDGAEDLAIGVPFEDIGAGPIVDAGAVNVIYSMALPLGLGLESCGPVVAEIWHQNQAGIPNICEAGDLFGSALAAGDFNGDGGDDLAIGVPNEDLGASIDCGAVNTVYSAFFPMGLDAVAPVLPEFWHQDSACVNNTNESGDFFGRSLTVGDWDMDFVMDLGIGLPGEDLGAAVDCGMVDTIYGAVGALGLEPCLAIVSESWHQNSPGIPDVNEVGDTFGAALDNDD